MKRFLAVLICIFMLVSLLPAFAFAEEGGGNDPAAMQEGDPDDNIREGADPSLTLVKDLTLTQPAELEKKLEQPVELKKNEQLAELEKKVLQPVEPEKKLVQSEGLEKKLEQKLTSIVPTDDTKTTYEVSVSATPAAGGTVSGANTYEEDTNVTVTATANPGYRFVGWKEGGNFIGGATANTYTFVATKDRKIVAAFELDVGENKYRITAEAYPAEGGSVTGAGDYEADTTVTLTATANAGYKFVGWKEGGNFIVGETATTYTFTATKGRKVVAAFELDVGENKYRITAEAYPAEGGSVTGAGDYDANAIVTLTATASEGYKFAGWKEGGNPIGEATGNHYTFVATKGRHIVALFEKINESIPTKTTIKVSDSKVTYGKPLTITVSVSSAMNYSGMLDLRINGKNYGEPQDIGNDGEVTWKVSASKSYGFKLGDNKIEAVYIGTQDVASLLPVTANVKVTSACKPQPVCKPSHYCCGQNHFTGKCVTVRSGEDVTFKVELGCNESCQWYIDKGDGCGFVKIKGATCPTLTVKDVTYKQDGYRYRCVIRNCCETIRTPIFTLNVASGQLYTPKTGDSSGMGLAIAIAAMGLCLLTLRRRAERS